MFDLSIFSSSHPGGSELITDHAGNDVTKEFKEVHEVDVIKHTLTKDQYSKAFKGKVDRQTIPQRKAAAPKPKPKQKAAGASFSSVFDEELLVRLSGFVLVGGVACLIPLDNPSPQNGIDNASATGMSAEEHTTQIFHGYCLVGLAIVLYCLRTAFSGWSKTAMAASAGRSAPPKRAAAASQNAEVNTSYGSVDDAFVAAMRKILGEDNVHFDADSPEISKRGKVGDIAASNTKIIIDNILCCMTLGHELPHCL